MLTTAQYTTLKNAILGDPALNAFPNTSDGNFDLAHKLSVELQPPGTFVVWTQNIPVQTVGNAMLSTDVANLTATNLSRLQVLAQYALQGFDASANVEAGFNDVFSVAGASGTRANLHIVWRRFALRIEAILATGTGSDASPATMGYEGAISPSDVTIARNT